MRSKPSLKPISSSLLRGPTTTASEAQGVLNVDLIMGRKTVLTSFFIVSSKSTYTVLLGRDWIHDNCCIPSTMHQCLIQWDGDNVEVVHVDDSIKISLTAMSV
jgi:hypothetical protein